MTLNWLAEAMKWKYVLNNLQQISIFEAYKSVLAGVAFGIVTPNRIGELIGRLLFIDEDKKISASLLNIVCTTIQLIVTLFFGLLSLIFFKENWLYLIPFSSLLSILFLLLIILFSVFFLLIKIPNINSKIIEYTVVFKNLSLRQTFFILFLSVLRYSIFSLQYFLVLRMLHIELSEFSCFVCIALNFFLITVIPTYALAEIGVRGTVAVAVFSVYGIPALPIASASLIVWIINLAIPALLGATILIRE